MWDFIKDRWGIFKDSMERGGGLVLVSGFVGLCWLYFASLIDPGTTALLLVVPALLLVAWLSYRFLSLFMK